MSKYFDRASDAHWRRLLRRFSASSLSVREFCARHGVSQANFYSQRRRLSVTIQSSSSSLPPAAQSGLLFLPVRVVGDEPRVSDAAAAALDAPASAPASSPTDGRIELLLDGGITVRLCGEVSPGRLAAVLGVLGRKGVCTC